MIKLKYKTYIVIILSLFIVACDKLEGKLIQNSDNFEKFFGNFKNEISKVAYKESHNAALICKKEFEKINKKVILNGGHVKTDGVDSFTVYVTLSDEYKYGEGEISKNPFLDGETFNYNGKCTIKSKIITSIQITKYEDGINLKYFSND